VKKDRALLVDPATSGIAACYINAYYEALLETADYAVNANSPFGHGKKYFYKRSELGTTTARLLGRFRLYFRGLELVVGLTRTFLLALKRNSVCVYALSSNLALERVFLKLLRMFKVRTIIICHDVIPFAFPGVDFVKVMSKRKKLFIRNNRQAS
jgi:hypothetical protein